MPHTKTLFLGTVMAIAINFSLTPALANETGNWTRPNGSIVKIWNCGEGLCASSRGVMIFNQILRSAEPNTWKGKMKHPEMLTFMTLRGTIHYRGNTMRVQGCVFGNSGCQIETWRK